MIYSGLPVTYSTLDSAGLMTQVSSQYDLGAIACCQFWHRGLSDIYLVETAHKAFILRVSQAHWRSHADIAFELELLDFLHHRGVPVAYPLRTLEGKLMLELAAPEGPRYAAVFVYAAGQVAVGDLNLAQGKILGETLAQVHHIGSTFRCLFQRQSLTLDYLLDASWQLILPFLQQRPQDLAYGQAAIAELKAQLGNFPQESPYWVPCWGDPHSGNAHFTTANQITLFDFDQCGYGWRIFDIAKFWHLALRTGLSKHVRQAVLDGYQSVLALTTEELAALNAFTQVAHIWVWGIGVTHAKVHNYSRLDDFFFTQRLEQLKSLRSHDWQLF
jgi:Ser/Thr protein kinase RdoA (MazF antagonist)